MRFVLVVGVALIAIILLKLKSKYKTEILFLTLIALTALSAIYNYRQIRTIVPFYSPKTQTFYQPEFNESGEYPDALLTVLFKGKKVYTKDDWYTLQRAEEENKSFHYAYYHAYNAQNFIEVSGGELIKDTEMNDVFIKNTTISDDFKDIGYANDMFRYTFLYNSYWEEMGNYFTYYWYYYEYLKDIHVYMCKVSDNNDATPFSSDELVVLWDQNPDKEEENLYVMTKAYYDKEVACNE